MKLGSTRELSGLRPVLKDENASGPDPVYWVFSDISGDKWANLTVIAPGLYGDEYPKTYGHYHGTDVDETYHLIEGEGILLMQKKHVEDGTVVPGRVDKVYLIRVKPGEEIIITPEWGHSWSNVGKVPLLSFDDWTHGHSPSDYEIMEQLKGMAYYLTSANGEITPVANPHYQDLPEAEWIDVTRWNEIRQS